MSTTITPTFTDNITVLAATTVAKNAVSRSTWDLRSKRGGWAFIRIGRGGTTAINGGGIVVHARRTINNDGTINPTPEATLISRLTAASSTTVNSDSNSGQNALNVASSAGFAAGDIVSVEGASQARLEWGRVSKVGAGVITLDANLKNSHTSAQADTVRNQADVWSVWLDGGATYELIIDYGAPSTGDTATIQILGQTYDSDIGA